MNGDSDPIVTVAMDIHVTFAFAATLATQCFALSTVIIGQVAQLTVTVIETSQHIYQMKL